MIRRLAVLTAILASSTPPVQAEVNLQDLNQDALQEAFRVLREGYVRGDELGYTELNRAALGGLLESLKSGATLVETNAQPGEETQKIGFLADILNLKLGYLRPATYQAAEIEVLDESIASFKDTGVTCMILDLRVPQSDADLATAAQFLSRFLPNVDEKLLFQIQKPDSRPVEFLSSKAETWDRDLFVLVDTETCNAGELIAEILRKERSALIVGAPTPGLTVEYEQIPLNETTLLKFAASEVLLADGSSLFQKGVQPDYMLPPNLEKKRRVIRSTESGTWIRDFVFETARPRHNEAALVNRTNPELTYRIKQSKGIETGWENTPTLDPVLQRAVDLVETTRFLASDPDTREP